VKTATASSPRVPQPTIQNTKVLKMSVGPTVGAALRGRPDVIDIQTLGLLGETVAGKVAKKISKQAVTAPAKR
jgi:hypothetical protein